MHTRSVDGLTVHTRPVRKQLHLGENITLPCTVLGPGFSPFNNPIMWYKVVGQTQIQLNNGGVVFAPFVGTGRYDITHKMGTHEPKVSVPLHLKGMYSFNPLDPTDIPSNMWYFPRISPNSLRNSPKCRASVQIQSATYPYLSIKTK